MQGKDTAINPYLAFNGNCREAMTFYKEALDGERMFNNLSAGGTVTMPWNKTFWHSMFGMFTDKFGMDWMISVELNEEE